MRAAVPSHLAAMALLGALSASGAYSQTASAKPAFAAASIKPADRPDEAGVLQPTPGTLRADNMAVRAYIRWAWNVNDYQMAAPESLRANLESRYSIVAKGEGAEPVEQLRLMLQSLLAERFHLAAHFEKRDIPVFAMVVGKDGPKQLHDPAPGNVPHMQPDSAEPEAGAGQRWLFYNLPVSAVMGIISNGLSRPILDMTGIAGSFDFAFVLPKWNRADGPLGDFVVSEVFPELQRQLGLRIQTQTAPVDMLVIDRVDRAPTGN